jgi:hypothetical protein
LSPIQLSPTAIHRRNDFALSRHRNDIEVGSRVRSNSEIVSFGPSKFQEIQKIYGGGSRPVSRNNNGEPGGARPVDDDEFEQTAVKEEEQEVRPKTIITKTHY